MNNGTLLQIQIAALVVGSGVNTHAANQPTNALYERTDNRKLFNVTNSKQSDTE